MIAIATIIFREFLEIVLVISIVMAATFGLKGRVFFVILGSCLGLLGSVIIAFFMDVISRSVDGIGQEIFNAIIMFISVIFLGSTVIWMKKYNLELTKNLQQMGQDLLEGKKTAYVLIAVVALATFREGSEIVLFTYGIILSSKLNFISIVFGGLLGAIGGLLVGSMLYLGILKMARKHLFIVTSWMLILLSAGMAAQGANFLIAADILPALSNQLWDSSHLISGNSFIGEILTVLIGYTPKPTAMELIFYCTVLFSVGFLYQAVKVPNQITLA